jgi:hypothetical protein
MLEFIMLCVYEWSTNRAREGNASMNWYGLRVIYPYLRLHVLFAFQGRLAPPGETERVHTCKEM